MKVLVLIDLQNDFIDGALGTQEAKEVVPKIVEKLKSTNMMETLVFFTKDTHYQDYLETLEGKMLPVIHCIENTEGWNINKEICDVVKSSRRIACRSDKINNGIIYKNTFGSDDLREFLLNYKNEIKELEFCGVCTDVCVISNVLMARQALPNTKIIVNANCCAGTTPKKHFAALEVMKSCQIDVI